jgi:hypothetical protein
MGLDFWFKECQNSPGAMVQAYNPSSSGGVDQKDCSSRVVQVKPSQNPIATNDWAQWCAYHPGYTRKHK